MRKLFHILSFLPLLSCAQEDIDYYQFYSEGNERYEQGDFTGAAESYQLLVDANLVSPELYYNLGNTHFKMGHTAYAILNYERALKIRPGFQDAEFNLQVANQHVVDKIEDKTVASLTDWWRELSEVMNVTAWAVTSILMFMLAMGLLALFSITRSVGSRRVYFWMAILLVAGTLFAYFSAQTALDLQQQQMEAIVLSPTVTVKSEPNEGSNQLFVIHEGTKTRILQQQDEWWKIELRDGKQGWVTVSEVAAI